MSKNIQGDFQICISVPLRKQIGNGEKIEVISIDLLKAFETKNYSL